MLKNNIILPYHSVLRVPHNDIAAKTLCVAAHLLPDLLPPAVPRLAALVVLKPVKELDRSTADQPAYAPDEPGWEALQGDERVLQHLDAVQGPVGGREALVVGGLVPVQELVVPRPTETRGWIKRVSLDLVEFVKYL